MYEFWQRSDGEWESRTPKLVVAYRDAMRSFCERWPLDRLYPISLVPALKQAREKKDRWAIFDMSQPDGCEDVHAWCNNRASGFDFSACGRPTAAWAIEFGEPRVLGVHEDHDTQTRFIFADCSGSPSLELHLVDSWYPAKESRRDVEKRL